MLTAIAQPGSVPIHLLHEEDCEAWIAAQAPSTQAWIRTNQYRAERGRHLFIPDAWGEYQAGPSMVLWGLGRRQERSEISLWDIAGLPDRLGPGAYHFAAALPTHQGAQAALGWLYGQYRFERYRRKPSAASAASSAPVLQCPPGADLRDAERIAAACALARDLINTPTSDLDPEALVAAAVSQGERYGATYREYVGEELLTGQFPAVHAVGRASTQPPRLLDMQWGEPSHPKVTLVGKGVVFDSGGLDIKPSASMLLMKKDMGGAACAIAVAQLVMDARLPVRLRLIVPAVENAIAGNAFRPGDVLQTRKGLSVEVGNTDAEGRLILCDALAMADEEKPDLLIDLATLTGAARVALGAELPALFSPDPALRQRFAEVALAHGDPVWGMPLWSGYDDELSSKIADLNNVSNSGFAGAIIGALFLRRFVTATPAWVHLDLYAWNSKDRPGRPVGAEPHTVRALYAYLRELYAE